MRAAIAGVCIYAGLAVFINPKDNNDGNWLGFKPPRGPCNKYTVGKNYVINLDRRSDRMDQAFINFGKESINFERVSAVDGKESFGHHENCSNIPAEVVDAKIAHRVYNTKYNAQFDPAVPADANISLCAGEIGCIYSHVNVWRMIAESNSSADGFSLTCVFEDDAKPVLNFHHGVEQVLSELPCEKSLDMLYLGYIDYFWPLLYFDFPREKLLHIKQKQTSYSTVQREPAFSTVAYCLTKGGAQKLLDELPVKGPIDLWINEMNSNKKVLDVRLANPKLAQGGWDGSEFWSGSSDVVHGSLINSIENSTTMGAIMSMWYKLNEAFR